MTADRRASGRDFAALLRQRRRAAALTQAELAKLAGLAVRTVREAERGRTSRPQRTTAVLLADALGLAGSERTGFLGAARGAGQPPVASSPRAAADHWPVTLAPAPVLVGRDDELSRLAGLVAGRADPAGGPLALVGVAGVGKSVLALAVAHRVAGEFPGGVASVPVDADSVADDLLDAITAGFLVASPDQLAGSPGLLLLDGADRIGTGLLRKVLAQLPDSVRVLATGRVPLAVPGERVWPVTPLAVPPARPAPLSQIAGSPAAELFLTRLARVRPEPLATDEVPALVGLVRRVGGLPLALELAAAQGRLLRLPQILRRYGDRALDLGEGDGEEQPLRAAMAGTYRLLGPGEQAALRRLAVFRGRWSVELAERLLAASGFDGDPVPLLDRLVNLGLLELGGVGEDRFQMVRLVRDFALEQSERRGELAAARQAHSEVIADLTGRLAVALAGPELPQAAARLDDLAGEVWSALSYAANRHPQTALRLAAGLYRWWRIRGLAVAGRGWLRRLLADPAAAGAEPATRAWAMVGVARLGQVDGAGAAELPTAQAALAEFRRLGDPAGQLAARRILGEVCRADGRYDEALRHDTAALALAVRHRRDRDAALAQLGLAWHELRAGAPAAARQRLAAADRLAAQSGDQRLRLLANAALAELLRLTGQPEQAAAIARRVLAGLAELGEPDQRWRVLGTLGQASAALGDVERAEQVLAELRAAGQRVPGGSGVAGRCAAIEAWLALARGDRVVAAEWFAAAAAAFGSGGDRLAEIDVTAELASCLPDPQRRRVLAELARRCREEGFVPLPRERAILGNLWPAVEEVARAETPHNAPRHRSARSRPRTRGATGPDHPPGPPWPGA